MAGQRVTLTRARNRRLETTVHDLKIELTHTDEHIRQKKARLALT